MTAGHDDTERSGLRAALRIERDRFTLEAELTVEPGSTVALLGPNGAGKSTLLQTLAGLLPLDRGRIELDGRALDDPVTRTFVVPEHRHIGVVFQGAALFEHLSVADNAAFALRHRHDPDETWALRRRRRRPSRRAARAAVEPLLADLDLTDLGDRRPHQLSGGQAQRVALARALAGRPRLLLLDEPLAAVDVSTRATLRQLLIERLGHFAGPRLVVTHDPAEAAALADELVVLEAGRVVQRGAPAAVQRHPSTPWVAALTGVNFLTGRAAGSRIHLDGIDMALTAVTDLTGPVRAVIDPNAVSLHRERPEGSPRNTWASVVDWVEPLGRTTRVRLGAPLPLTADITPSSATSLGLGPGQRVWAAVKATEIEVETGSASISPPPGNATATR